MEQEIEEWADINGLQNEYQISSLGRLRSLDMVVPVSGGGSRKVVGRIRRNAINKNRYVVNSIRNKTYFIHVEVAKAFIPNPENKPEVNHLDGDKSNCKKSNLAWVTRIENIEHAFKNKLIKPAVGVNQSQTKLTEEQVRLVMNSPNKGMRQLGRELGVDHKSISAIRNGRSWNHITGLPRNEKLDTRKYKI